ncbi:MAG: prephenate dehydrogenase/arogenate dehydrogenase family protein [SAR86 cluster bacterium]|uniref:Prephenate dehydrogenase/arogenate dehydrogenase family protein n=1 Tax=SAR86 cluster bacterium TaxID=2030880 RepID=A0A937HYZ1_9GAMM|nr:prephenate dehydrogenase/arogenate dehydrogenase family protein [SAR86 cluster bacterium]
MKKTFLKNNKNIQFLIIGLGLIGGSLAKRLSKNGYEVLAVDKNKSHLNYAKKSKIIVGSSEKIDYEKKLFVIVALPPKILHRNFENYLDFFHKADFITDCTSVKGSLLNKIRKNKLESKFILSHPIAGSEKSGFLNSNEDLFKDKISIILKHKGLATSTLQKSKELWFELGSKTHNLDSKLHDKIFSLTSHLPHIVAFSLISLFSKRKTSEYKKYIGGGLKDFTRIAESDPMMWENIFSLNKNNLLKDISDIEKEINKIKTYILQDDGSKLVGHLKKIKKTKESLNR